MPSTTAVSIDSSNFAVAVSFAIFKASATGYRWLCSTLVRIARVRLERWLIAICPSPLLSLHRDPHAASRSGDRSNGGIQAGRGQIRHLRLGDFFGLGARDLAYLVGMRFARTFFHLGRFLDQYCGRR